MVLTSQTHLVEGLTALTPQRSAGPDEYTEKMLVQMSTTDVWKLRYRSRG